MTDDVDDDDDDDDHKWSDDVTELLQQYEWQMLHGLLPGISITKSFGTFWRFGSCMVTRPVDVNVSTTLCMRSIPSELQYELPRCRGNTTFVSDAVRRRHSRMTPGNGWNFLSFSRMSLAVLHTGLARLSNQHTMFIINCSHKDTVTIC